MDKTKREKLQYYVLDLLRRSCEEDPDYERFGYHLFNIAQTYIEEMKIDLELEERAEADISSICSGLKENKYITWSEVRSKTGYRRVFLTEKGRDELEGRTKYSQKEKTWVNINADNVFAQIGGSNNQMEISISNKFAEIYNMISELNNDKELVAEKVKNIEQEVTKSNGDKNKVLESLAHIAKVGADKIVEKIIGVLIDKAMGLN